MTKVFVAGVDIDEIYIDDDFCFGYYEDEVYPRRPQNKAELDWILEYFGESKIGEQDDLDDGYGE